MLENDPPIGTRVKFLRNIKKAKKDDLATLVRPMRKNRIEHPGDEYEVEFLSEYFVVQRHDIERAY